MDKPSILAYVEDLSLQAEIQGMADEQKLFLHFATQGEPLTQYTKTFAPFMLIVDVSGLSSEWLFRHIGSIRNAKPAFPIIAIVAPLQDDMASRAEKYGCNRVLTKPEIKTKLPKIITDSLTGRLNA